MRYIIFIILSSMLLFGCCYTPMTSSSNTNDTNETSADDIIDDDANNAQENVTETPATEESAQEDTNQQDSDLEPGSENETTTISSSCVGPTESDMSVRDTVLFYNKSYTDVCIDYSTVKDYYCNNGVLESINDECNPGNRCNAGKCEPVTFICSETDGGINVFQRGKTTVVYGMNTPVDEWDECVDEGKIIEYYCLGDGTATSEQIICPSGYKCVSDRCVRSNCDETDGGLDIYVAGKTTAGGEERNDDCITERRLREYYCYGDDIESTDEYCDEGYICDNDRCELE
ncbi:hypothetical protein KKF81_04740 [Candidatus Micrarchaeota archaeon]|nr:hypothetical protein [Candidatus Micrarchaeota archaeon]MBU1166234.1 hypothetical protein [Candidatus Micrarchaeota archaeon]MBU1886809.1 hypothetical protein [Candidatus Micrarchaeota archaeon]